MVLTEGYFTKRIGWVMTDYSKKKKKERERKRPGDRFENCYHYQENNKPGQGHGKEMTDASIFPGRMA